MNATIKLVAGDTKPTRLQYLNGDTPINITGYSFVLKIGYAVPKTVNGVITDAVNGIYEFRWANTDLVAGNPPMELLVTDSAAKEKTHKLGAITILPRII